MTCRECNPACLISITGEECRKKAESTVVISKYSYQARANNGWFIVVLYSAFNNFYSLQQEFYSAICGFKVVYDFSGSAYL